MEQIQTKAIETYRQNLEFLKIYDNELFHRISNLSHFIELGEYKERYTLEYIKEDQEFDIYDIRCDNYIYNKKPKEFIKNAVKNTNFDKANVIMMLDDKYYNNKFKIDIPEDFDHGYSGDPSIMNNMQEYSTIFNKSTLSDKKFKNIKKFCFVGTLLGTHILPIHNKIKAYGYFISEANLEIFRLSLFVTNYKMLSQSSNLIFSIMDEKDIFFKKLGKYYQFYFPANHMIKYYSTNYNIKDYFDRILEFISLENPYFYSYPTLLNKISNIIENIHSDLIINTINNNEILAEENVLFLAAGPSLDKNISWIKSHKNNFFIVAISAVVIKLIENEIVPDLIINADEKAFVATRFPDSIQDKYCDISFITTSATNKSVLEKFNKTNRFLYEVKTQIKENSSIIEGASVSEQSLDLLHIFGAKNIYLLGVDLSYDSDTGASHMNNYSETSHIEISNKNYENNNFMKDESYNDNTTIVVKGNFRKDVVTSVIFNKSIYGMNKVINKYHKNNKHINIYNLSDGAYFEHTIPLQLNKLNIGVKNNKHLDLNKELHNISSGKLTITEIKRLKDSIDFFDNILNELDTIEKLKVKTYVEFVKQREKLFVMISSDSLKYQYISADRILLNYVLISEPYLEYSFNENIKNEANIIKKVKKVWVSQIRELCNQYKNIIIKVM